MTEIYIHFLFDNYGLYGNAPVGIDIDEWMAAVLNSSAFSLRRAAHRAFEALDANADGVVDR